MTNQYGRDTEVCDPVLIATGTLPKRAIWNQMNLRPYVTHAYADGHRSWFYDSFIFCEGTWYDRETGEVRVLGNASGGQLPATKADWIAFMDHIFSPAHDLSQLDAVIGKWKETLGEPPMRHKVILNLCLPAKDGRGTPNACSWKKFDFGEIDGVDMDFSKVEHRIAATKWYVDELVRRYEEQGYTNFDLAGLYWVEESLYSNEEIVTEINDYIHSKGLRSYWIPYWANNDQYAIHWGDRYHFDMAWRQPNYAFYNADGSLPNKAQLVACIKSCKTYGLGLELEFETMLKSSAMHETSPEMHQRLIDYIDAFETYGVWDDGGVAHYGGSKGFCDMAASMDPVNQATMDRLCDIVQKRQKAFAGIEAPEVSEPAQPLGVYAVPGGIHISESTTEASVFNSAGMLVHEGNGFVPCAPGLYFISDGAGRTAKVAVR